MEVFTTLAELQRERHQVIEISDKITNDLRTLRIAQEAAKSPSEVHMMSIQHGRALQSLNRAQQRLRELNASIKWHNMKAQYEIQQQAKRERRERAARRKKAVA
jgi:hypothetical protein